MVTSTMQFDQSLNKSPCSFKQDRKVGYRCILYCLGCLTLQGSANLLERSPIIYSVMNDVATNGLKLVSKPLLELGSLESEI